MYVNAKLSNNSTENHERYVAEATERLSSVMKKILLNLSQYRINF